MVAIPELLSGLVTIWGVPRTTPIILSTGYHMFLIWLALAAYHTSYAILKTSCSGIEGHPVKNSNLTELLQLADEATT